MPARERPLARRSQGSPPGPGPPARPRKIVFEDELPALALLGARKSDAAGPGERKRRPRPVPDYELKYPPLRSRGARNRYVAVFQDQHAELWKLQREVGATQAKLQQLESVLRSLPPPRGQEQAQAAARVRRELEKKRLDPGFLHKQARCHYLKGKLRHLKTQIQKFDDHADSEGPVYF